MSPDEDHQEWLLAADSVGWIGDRDDKPSTVATAPRKYMRVQKVRYCLHCALPVDDHSPGCSQYPGAENPIPWPASFGTPGGWVER